MSLSWNEIRSRAVAFSHEWADESSESAEAKSFWDQFFKVFGVNRRRIAVFERYVKAKGGDPGFIDLFWPSVLIAEHKSRGKSLDRAYTQALDYFPGIKDEELPRYIIVSDFARFRVHDLEDDTSFEFALSDLPENIQRLGFIAGYEKREFKEQDPVNAKAAEKLAQLHDAMRDCGYTGHRLEVYLVRVLFCLFADDTGIFMPRGTFLDFIETCTREDGSDTGARLNELFDVLDTPEADRLKTRDERLLGFPHVNGKLFEETLRTPAFDTLMRDLLLDCCQLDWGKISPAIFGSLFQGIMDAQLRRNLGAHYTSEKNILKLIGPLFMDALWGEFERVKNQPGKLKAFHENLGTLHFFDPACGCGNFLVISYREIRLLELEVIKRLYAKEAQQLSLDAISQYVKVDVDQFHGIEIEEWPAQIAQVAMWLIDHQMNLLVGEAFGQAVVRIPLVKSANIVHGNALQLDWNEVLPAERCSYILGNPPFIGHQLRNREQMADMRKIWGDEGRYRRLDYVSCWYRLASDYMARNSAIRAALVSTNSICQGEQVGTLWPWLLEQGVKIHFAHRTFHWRNEAPGVAAVHCVVIGFGLSPADNLLIFDYGQDSRGNPVVIKANRINPYLVDADDVILPSRTSPVTGVPPMVKGSQPTDGGHLLMSDEEKAELISLYPAAEKFIKPFIGAREFINNISRWCLWLKDIPATDLRQVPPVLGRIRNVRDARLASPTVAVQRMAEFPSLFTQDRQPESDYIVVPRHSSARRRYLPIGFFSSDVICGDHNMLIPDADLYLFGVLNSTMHNAWVRSVAGRIKSDIRYAPAIYNTFPWPSPSDAQRARVEKAAQEILDARAGQSEASLADLYDPLTMPPKLLVAHQSLDRSVDAAYGRKRFEAEAERVAFLFELYQRVTSLLPKEKTPKKSRSRP